MEIKTNLSELRAKRGLGVTHLVQKVGVSRQALYAIEAGEYAPSTFVSLKLARALESTVEELFQLPAEEGTAAESATTDARA